MLNHEFDINFYKQSFIQKIKEKKRHRLNWNTFSFFSEKKLPHTSMHEAGIMIFSFLAILGYCTFHKEAPLFNLLSACSYLQGVYMGIRGSLKLRAHHESNGQIPISSGVLYSLIAAFLLAVPIFFTTASECNLGQN